MTSAIAAASAAAAIANVMRRTERSSSARPRTSTWSPGPGRAPVTRSRLSSRRRVRTRSFCSS